ncbi:MAG: sigma-70 family RNA polymerase sigma factor [Oscillospiraceae bacterium]|nr:sigma-70 family RNA polymerase sigma factor [Ruminococcus sp.]MCD8344516.1 sigma-70 family RNA polymerase sigma factor [Oscillospiraceae bacterium]
MEFEEIYRTYFKSVYNYILRLSGNEHIAEEITSDTFFKAMKSIGKFRGECDIRVWLCQIAKNSYYSYLKKSRKTESIDDVVFPEIVDPNASPEELASRKEDFLRVRKALHDIAEPYKEVFMWRVFGELSFKEIGELYGKTDNWACVTYHRARKMIRLRMEEQSNE